MRAYIVNEFGVPGAVGERPTPEPGEGQILVRVRAAGVNSMDAIVVAGYAKEMLEHRFPLTPGLDFSGVVEKVGPGVASPKVGDEVVGLVEKAYMGEGSFAEYVTTPAASVVQKSQTLSFAEAASLPTASLTALAALNAAGVSAGQSVVILGSTGGVGSFATQLVAQRGARAIAVAGADKADYARSLGATEVVESTGDPAAAIRVKAPAIDAVLDFAGIAPLLASVEALVRKGGHIVSTAAQLDPAAYEAKGLTGRKIMRAPAASLDQIAAQLAKGELRLPALRVLPLEQAANALAEQGQRHVRGKIVLEVAK